MARDPAGPVESLGREAMQTARSAAHNPWVERLARFGYAARGVVYALVGGLALRAATGTGGETTDAEGALSRIGEQSRPLLLLIAIGLFGYALWRFIQAVLDTEGKGADGKGLAQRLGMLATGIVYSGLAVAAMGMATGGGGGGAGGGEGTQGFTAKLMGAPFGVALVALAGAAVIAYGLAQIKSGWTGSFQEKLKLSEMTPAKRQLAVRVGRIGLIARGVVFLLTGAFLIRAALAADPSEAQGLGGALATVAAQPYGPWLLALVAAGLVAFGIHSLVEARYRRIYM